MSEIIATVEVPDLYAITVSQQNTFATTDTGTIYLDSISQIGDVDTSILQNGSVLVYNSSTQKWTSTIYLTDQDMEAGEF